MSGHTEAHEKPTDAGIAAAYVIRECVGDKAHGGVTQNTGKRRVQILALRIEGFYRIL